MDRPRRTEIARRATGCHRLWGLLSSGLHADVAQLVEHHLAKVRVAGSNPVVRSTEVLVSGRAVPCTTAESRLRGVVALSEPSRSPTAETSTTSLTSQ